MRISDWSSDVCSSDLRRARALAVHETSALVGEQRDAQPDAVGERHTDSALRTEPVIAAIIRLDIAVEAVRRAARDQVHNACGAVAAVEGALRPLQDLDAFDIEERRREEDVRGLIDIVDVHRDRGAAVRAVIVLAADAADADRRRCHARSEEHTSELQSLMRISYA